MSKAIDLIRSFVDKSGGIEKIDRALSLMRAMDKSQIHDFIKGIANHEDPAGAHQLFAAMMMGFTVASSVYHSTAKSLAEEP